MFIWFHVHANTWRAHIRGRENASLRADTLGSKHKLFLSILNRCQFLFLSSFPMLLAPFFSTTTTLSFHSQSLSASFLILFSQCSLLPSFRWFYAYELVVDDVGEETIAQTSPAEQSRPLWTKWPVSMAPLSPGLIGCHFVARNKFVRDCKPTSPNNRLGLVKLPLGL